MHALNSAWETLKRDYDAGCAQSARAARWEVTNDLNQLLRRLRQYEGESDWFVIVIESVTRFVKQAAIFEVADAGQCYRLRKQSGFSLPDDLVLKASEAPAFQGVFSSQDPVVALRNASEVGPALAAEELTERAHLIPVLNGDRVVAVLFAADPDYVDVNALEVVAGVASVVLERSRNVSKQVQLSSLPATPASQRVLPDWADLPELERNQHLAAQRFARTIVAEWQLAKPEACHAGRNSGSFYLHLRPEIERARAEYQKRFMQTPSMVDYLHLELLKTAAEGDPEKLGAEYPGPLV